MKLLTLTVTLFCCALLNGQAWTTYDVSNSGIVSDLGIKINFDTNGDVFVGTQNGLSIKSGSTWTSHTVATGDLPNNSVSSTLRNNSDIWVGTDNGLARYNGTTWSTYNTGNSVLPDNRIYCLEKTQSGIVWIGTRDGGLCSYNGTAFTPLSISANISVTYNRAHAIKMDANGVLWIGTAGGGLARYNTSNGQWAQYTTSNSTIPSNDVYSLAIAPDGKIWAGTSAGVGIFDPSVTSFTNIFTTSNSILPNNYIRGVSVDMGGRGYIAMGYGGVARVETNMTITTLWNSSNSALPTDTIWHCNYDAGRLWVASFTEGIAVMDVDVSISELLGENLTISANPTVTNGNTVLSLEAAVPSATDVEMFSASGQLVWSQTNVSVIPGTTTTLTLPMEGLARGRYIVTVTDADHRHYSLSVFAQ